MIAKTAPAAAPIIELRQATPADQPFLHQLYASTRPPSRLRACDAEAEALLVHVQFLARQTDWGRRFPGADVTIIVEHDRPVGCLYVHYTEHEVRLVDLSLLPEFRRRGIGKGLLRGLQAHGERLGLPVRLHVTLGNPCQRLCQRCDFLFMGIVGGHAALEWKPA
ncbi:GNAT family N-acetyltransferase [Duganella sp. FT92W]|uniref:GNAT family N-acetyltransferase n=1 Tax=Pseudoduganella rivuli TaxID=2666085 RepID=A0A7X2IRX2_9BURK|nr:GNAT family N-acetyltransferase [Pseudoduganella rivuli]MRV74936.1 GNAT family N-acetyltransferase [Pseudoduganella rivuli]